MSTGTDAERRIHQLEEQLRQARDEAAKTVEARQYITNIVAEDIAVLVEQYLNPMLKEVGSGLQFHVKPRPIFDAFVTPGKVLVTDWHLTLKGTRA